MLIYKGKNTDKSLQRIINYNPDKIHLSKDRFITDEVLSSVLILVPTRRKLRELQKEIVKKSISPVVEKINIETIETMAENILKQSKKPFRVISDPVAAVLIRESLDKVKNELQYFPQNELPTGTLRSLHKIISEYKRHPITFIDLKNEAERNKLSESEKRKTKDIAKIYEAYNIECKDANLKEIGDIYTDLNHLTLEDFKNCFTGIYNGAETVHLSGYNNFTQNEIELLDKLSNIVDVIIDFDYDKGNEYLFGHLKKLYKKFTEDKSGWDCNEDDLDNKSKFKDHIQKHYNDETFKTSEFKDNIIEIEAADREQEVDLIAKNIKHIIHDRIENVAPHEICIVFNRIENYSSLIRDKFSEYKIPVNLTDRKLLINSHPVQALLNFLEIKLNDFHYKDIMRAFSSGFISLQNNNYKFNEHFNNEKVESHIIYSTAKDLKIVSGYSNWENSIKEKLEYLKKEKNELSDENLVDINITQLIKQYEKALSDIRIIYKSLSKFNHELTPAEFKNSLIDLIRELKIDSKTLGKFNNEFESKENFIDNFNYVNIEENARGYIKFLEVISELMDLITEVEEKEKFTFEYFISQIKIALKNQRFNILERSNYGVLITTLDQIRELKFKHLFIGGLVDGDFPTAYKPPIFIADTYAKKDDEHQSEERYLFYQILCNWEYKLYLSFPKIEEKREYEKSIFLKELENTVEMKLFDPNQYSSTVFSINQILRKYDIIQNKNEANEYMPVNENEVKASINIDKIRTENLFSKTVFTGNIISDSEIDERLLSFYDKIPDNKRIKLNENLVSKHEEKISNRVYSTSQLEVFAQCPFKYFSEKILNLKALEEPSEEMERNELGSLLHDVLFQFYSSLEDKKLVESNLSEYWKKIKIIAEKEIEERFRSDTDFIEQEKILGMNGKEEDSILFKFLEYEIENQSNFIPKYFERKFGYEDDFEIEGIKLRGVIDRIDIDEEAKTFRVVDYKLSGKSLTGPDIKEGKYLQLSIYLIAAEKILNYKYKPEEACIYSLKFNSSDLSNNVIIGNVKGAKATVEQAVNAVSEFVPKYFNSIKQADFVLKEKTDTEKICKYCNFKNICRYEGGK